jgi:hypothetical protein
VTPIPVAVGIGAVVAAYLAALKTLTDPAFVVALGPQSALDVTPVSFQSVEQEGRWKPESLVAASNRPGRVLEFAGHAEDPKKLPKSPQLTPPNPAQLVEVNCPLFSLDMPCIQSHLPGILTGANTVQRSTLLVDATWWCDGLEIYGGYAGLAKAQGFGSVWDTMAHVSLQAIPWGNYYPAATLLTWSGWVNPIGPQYWEFRGGMVVRADQSNSGQGQANASLLYPVETGPSQPYMKAQAYRNAPAYMKAWARDTGTNDVAPWDKDAGFKLTGN